MKQFKYLDSNSAHMYADSNGDDHQFPTEITAILMTILKLNN